MRWIILGSPLALMVWLSWPRLIRHVAPITGIALDDRPRSDLLIKAIMADDISGVRKLLDAGVSPNSCVREPDGGRLTLEKAAEGGDVAMVRLLLDRGAEVNGEDLWGGTAIVDASVRGNADVVKLLIDRGADVNIDDDDTSALDYAEYAVRNPAERGKPSQYKRIVRMLRNAGARHGFSLW